ncbi:MAG: hypothetical protein M1839_001129 [Geoglossum umbratile]|nr:MAG: hypothetical protein M1839_001129 [Geoglossum umbratile]
MQSPVTTAPIHVFAPGMDKASTSSTGQPVEDPRFHNAETNGLFEERVPRTRQVVYGPHGSSLRRGSEVARHCANNNREWVIARVESVFERIVDGILDDNKKLTIAIRSRGRVTGQAFDQEARFIRPTVRNVTREISFPGSTPKEAWNFTVLVRILQLVHEALVSDTTTTKRDMYYKDPGLFLKQDVVDRFVDDIACTFGVDRGCLNVAAAAKGLVAGALRINRKDSSVMDCASENGGILVQNVKDVDSIDLSEAKWILLIEKEATFRSLSTNRFWDNSRIGKGILITVILTEHIPTPLTILTTLEKKAKGYPDISTRAFLRLLSTSRLTPSPQPPPIYALVDFDPDGLSILSTYKYGSSALAHENSQLAVPSIRWLGIRSADLQQENADEVQGLLRLSARDRGKAVKMLGSEVFAEEAEWRREMQVMLFLNVKAEIQVVSGFGRVGLRAWLEGRVLGSI